MLEKNIPSLRSLMNTDWKTLFTGAKPSWEDAWKLKESPSPSSLDGLRHFLDLVHIKYCLVKPYQEFADYPLVETRELMPSFEADLWEHKRLPGFSLVALARPLNYFAEIFQFDLLRPIDGTLRGDHARARQDKNLEAMQSRLPRALHEEFRRIFQKEDITDLLHYPRLTSFIMNMDRGHVFSMHSPNPQQTRFHLSGVYASLPSDLDTEIKRYGQRIEKFTLDDPDSYEKNRNFVFQHLMELYGFPVASERRTSAALFARRLHKMGERFLIRTLGQSDRTLTTLWSDGGNRAYLHVEKTALVRIDSDQRDLVAQLTEGGYFIDGKRRVAILRVMYRQHSFSPDNVRQERALSVDSQDIIHPLTGTSLPGVSVVRETTNMVLRLNDIVQGEYTGRIAYKRNEIVENTNSEEKRLKFLYAWLSKHQRRIIGYSDEFFAGFAKVLDTYLFAPERYDSVAGHHDLYQELISKYSYILQARKVRILEELGERSFRGARIGYRRMLLEAVTLLHALKFEIVSYFDSLVSTAIAIGDAMLNDRYLLRVYIEKSDDALSPGGLEIKKNYGKLVSLLDEFRAIQKRRAESGPPE
jgi:hypothetical protein